MLVFVGSLGPNSAFGVTKLIFYSKTRPYKKDMCVYCWLLLQISVLALDSSSTSSSHGCFRHFTMFRAPPTRQLNDGHSFYTKSLGSIYEPCYGYGGSFAPSTSSNSWKHPSHKSYSQHGQAWKSVSHTAFTREPLPHGPNSYSKVVKLNLIRPFGPGGFTKLKRMPFYSIQL